MSYIYVVYFQALNRRDAITHHHYTSVFSSEFSQGKVGECVLGGVNNHIKTYKLHPLKDQRELLAKFKHIYSDSCSLTSALIYKQISCVQ